MDLRREKEGVAPRFFLYLPTNGPTVFRVKIFNSVWGEGGGGGVWVALNFTPPFLNFWTPCRRKRNHGTEGFLITGEAGPLQMRS